jgi:hypothetical protein
MLGMTGGSYMLRIPDFCMLLLLQLESPGAGRGAFLLM